MPKGRTVCSTMLNAVTSTGASSAIDAERHTDICITITAASVTTGGTVLIQKSIDDGTTWKTIHTESVTADGDTVVSLTGMSFKDLRTNVSARTDGTYTTEYEASWKE